jgi:hypothetical protein
MGAHTRRLSLIATGALAVLALVGCSAAARVDAAPVTPLPVGGIADYQLGGGYAPPAGVTIVTRDSTDKPAAGLYSICYINGFQTQPEDRSFWLKKHPTLVVRGSNGKPIIDKNWPDEMLLSPTSTAKRAAISAIIGKTITRCAAKGFQAVEFDNLDSWTRSHGKITKKQNIGMAKLLVKRAHKAGLAAGQKNTSELGKAGRDTIKFDFAVAEECYRWAECGTYTKIYGERVIDIEYTDDLRGGTFDAACTDPATPAMTILRDRDLTTPASKDYAYAHC